ncbi:signal peptidase [Nanobdella aerobiophila]|uniref:Signal peptidase n=1 Tax=Nanobdella aerobiophila TaxID=2586965 RepID=A0A915SY64_9ARCH|nr:hypothetical protein [Nanobdella aerobiophila]BBL45575.1 signal peptidase [Nanobdella aerobiophila]
MIKKLKKYIEYIFFGDDLKSDILFIILILIIYSIVNLIYPPLFSVIVSPSMEHTYFNIKKYSTYNITINNFTEFPYPNGLYIGDIVIILPINTQYLQIGDMILYKGISIYSGEDIFHRIIGYNNTNFIIMGDNNPGPIVFENENDMPPNRIVGTGILRIPFLGYIKILI